MRIPPGAHAGAVKIHLPPNQSLFAQQQGLVAMSNNGSLILQDEEHGICQISNGEQANELWLAGQLPGQALAVALENDCMLVHQEAVLGAETSLSYQSTTSTLAGPGQPWLQIEGSGTLLLSALGTIYTLQVDSEYLVNAAYIIAYSKALRYEPAPGDASSNGAHSSYTFIGKGFIWCQTHRPQMLGEMLSPHLKRLKARDRARG